MALDPSHTVNNALFFLKCMAVIAAIAITAALLYALLAPTVITVGVAAGLTAASTAAFWLLPLIILPIVAVMLVSVLLANLFTPVIQPNPWSAPVTRPWFARPWFGNLWGTPAHSHQEAMRAQPSGHSHWQRASNPSIDRRNVPGHSSIFHPAAASHSHGAAINHARGNVDHAPAHREAGSAHAPRR